MNTNKFLILAIALFMCIQGISQTSFYVSTKGKDTWPGTEKKPFASIEKAKQVVKETLASSQENITIFVRGGEYFIDEALAFDAKDGGKDKQQVVYKSYPGEMAVLTGGKKITIWEPDQNGIYKTSCEGMDFRQLFVNNSRAIRARQPNVGGYYNLMGWDLYNRHLILEGNQVQNWDNFKNVEAVIQMFWAEAIVQFEKVERLRAGTNQAYVSIRKEQADILFPRPYPQKQDDAAFHLENAYEFIDQPGEWYLNPETKVLYYKPEEDVDIHSLEIIAPVTETLIHIEGTLDEPVKNITFEGFTIEHANWSLPNHNGFINAQAGMYNLSAREDNYQEVRRPVAAITIKNAQNVVLQKNLVQHMGSTAIDLEIGTKECVVKANVIRSIAGNGIMVGAFTHEEDGEYHVTYNPADLREVCTGDVVSNNYIKNVACDYYGTCPVAAGYPAEIKITHNRIIDAPYCGISLGYGWTNKPNPMHDNLIANNHISNAMNLICDGGAIYTLSFQPGTRIAENFIDKMVRSKTAGAWPVAHLYHDEQSGGTEERPMVLERNCMKRSDKSILSWNFHHEGYIYLKNNLVYPIPDVVKKAGVQEEYKEVIKNLVAE